MKPQRSLSLNSFNILCLAIEFFNQIVGLSKKTRDKNDRKIIILIKDSAKEIMFSLDKYDPAKSRFKEFFFFIGCPIKGDNFISLDSWPAISVSGLEEEENIILTVIILSFIFNASPKVIFEKMKQKYELPEDLSDGNNYLNAFVVDEEVPYPHLK